MKLSVSMSRPLTAMILLTACIGRDTTDLVQVDQGGVVEPPTSSEQRQSPVAVSAVSSVSASVAAPTEAVSLNAVTMADPAAADPAPVDATADEAADEAAAIGAVTTDGGNPNAEDAGSVLPLGACLACAQARCPVQFDNAVGAASSADNLGSVAKLFDCVIGDDWESGNAIPQTSCFFADAAQPLGSLLPCYCGTTPLAQCLATGPVNAAEACGVEVELASDCEPVAASCVTRSGSNPEVALGDALQLLNCERAACALECGFPAPIEE